MLLLSLSILFSTAHTQEVSSFVPVSVTAKFDSTQTLTHVTNSELVVPCTVYTIILCVHSLSCLALSPKSHTSPTAPDSPSSNIGQTNVVCIIIIVGHTNSPICLVTAVLDYIRLRQDTSGAFFLDRHQCLVRKTWFIQQIRSILQFLGLPEHHYAGHSFRIVAATFAVQAGLKDSTIQTLERQQSVAFLQYIRLPWTHLAHISHQLSTAALNHTTSPNVATH